jgi:hypothetical protein
MPKFALVSTLMYDTFVLQKGLHYDDTSGIYPGVVSSSEARAWRGRFIDNNAQKATRLLQEAWEREHGRPISDRFPGEGPRFGYPPKKAVKAKPATIVAGQAQG